ncbi:MAG: hypothetical protein PHS44_00335 [Candidatus Dojkabacteria bacterium]|jgi:hypothetical protein|nr:hypothetical protein [Candidatus Dojkabacteria bacterium]
METVQLSPEHVKALNTLEGLRAVLEEGIVDKGILFTRVRGVCEAQGLPLKIPKNIVILYVVASVEESLVMGQAESAKAYQRLPEVQVFGLVDDLLRSASVSLLLRCNVNQAILHEIESVVGRLAIKDQTYENVRRVLSLNKGDIVQKALVSLEQTSGLDKQFVRTFDMIEHYFTT